MKNADVEKTAKDYSEYLVVDMKAKLDPLNKSLDDMFSRLEEFQTMIHFDKQERINASTLLTSLLDSSGELTTLFERIDAMESLVDHVKSNLQGLETQIEKAEDELGCSESKTIKVSNIFTPLLFKKTAEKPKTDGNNHTEMFKTEDYFH